MATKWQKLIAKHELERRALERVQKAKLSIETMSDQELQDLLDSPDEEEQEPTPPNQQAERNKLKENK